LVDELDDACSVELVERSRPRLHIEAAEIGVEVGRRGREAAAPQVVLVLLPPVEIFASNRQCLEISGCGKTGGEQGRVFGKLRYGDHRQLASHDLALERAVIDENQAVEPDIQAVGDGT